MPYPDHGYTVDRAYSGLTASIALGVTSGEREFWDRRAAYWRAQLDLAAEREYADDVHGRTAARLFGRVDEDTRSRAKTINFASMYGDRHMPHRG